ncbi:STAS domain-containing protein [Streptomyces sp. NPDC005438]|uniref:STAS domain-containing protein n=1 Tax=Streptomyces sp. NPDC005438 TaxID=3156880 RepID=UPI0033A37894
MRDEAEITRRTLTGARGQRATVVRVVGDVDYDSGPLLADFLREGEDGTERTVVDLSGLDFADSTILHVLLDAQRVRRARNGSLVLAGTFSETVDRLFEVTGSLSFFVTAPTVEAALDVPLEREA